MIIQDKGIMLAECHNLCVPQSVNNLVYLAVYSKLWCKEVAILCLGRSHDFKLLQCSNTETKRNSSLIEIFYHNLKHVDRYVLKKMLNLISYT